MNYLTKKWIEDFLFLKEFFNLKDADLHKETIKRIKSKSKKVFFDNINKNEEFAKLFLKIKSKSNLYIKKLENRLKILSHLPEQIRNNIKRADWIKYGFICEEDRTFLSMFANKLLQKIEKKADKANELTEKAQCHLKEYTALNDFCFEIIEETVAERENFIICFDRKKICVENYRIVLDDKLNFNKFDYHFPFSPRTVLYATELYYIQDNFYELHLLLENVDKYQNTDFWYLTLQGTNIKIL